MLSRDQFPLVISSLLKWVRLPYICVHLVILDCILDIANDMLWRLRVLLYSTKVY